MVLGLCTSFHFFYLGLRVEYRLLSLTSSSDLWAEEKPCLWSLMWWAGLERHSWVGGEHMVELGHTGAAGRLVGGPTAFTEPLCLPE